jgi:hypothetical protein
VAAEARLENGWWGGPVAKHFGHQIAEFSTRLLGTVAGAQGSPILFATKPGYGYVDDATMPSYFPQILDWLGVPSGTWRLVTRPTLVSELHVLPQAEQLLGPGPSASYLDALDVLTAERLAATADRDEAVYVSRAGLAARFAGEASVERALERVGVAVLRPEQLRLQDQLERYRSAGRLVFAEGSALHALQLMGRNRARVLVLNRRPGSTMAQTSLAPRFPELRYADVTATLIHGLRPNGRPALNFGMPVLAPDAFIAAFEAVGLPLSRGWDEAGYAAARDADILGWLEREAGRRVAPHAGHHACILATLDVPALGHLQRVGADVLRRQG